MTATSDNFRPDSQPTPPTVCENAKENEHQYAKLRRSRRETWQLWRRYVYPILVIPLLIFSLIPLQIYIVRLLGVCMVSLNNISFYDKIAVAETCTGDGVNSVGFVFLSQILGFGGPFYCCMIYYPFYLAYPEVVTLKRTKNRILMLIGFISLYICTIINIAVPATHRFIAIGITRGLMITYLFIVIPHVWKYDLRGRYRNLFLLQLEHDQVCCDKAVTFRPKFWTTLDVLIISMIILNLVSLLIDSSWDILFALLITLFLLWLAYLIWSERAGHFYRDFSYTYLLSVLPDIVLQLFIVLWRVMLDMMLNNDRGKQLATLIIYNLLIIIFCRVARRWGFCCVSEKRDAPVVIFPIRFLTIMFQYLFMYSMRDIKSGIFWTAYMIVLMANVFDTSGLLGDLYATLLLRFRNRRPPPVDGNFSRSNGLIHAYPSENFLDASGFDSSGKFLSASHLESQRQQQGASGLDVSHTVSDFAQSPFEYRPIVTAEPADVSDDVVYALDLIHQISYCMILNAALIAAILLIDIFWNLISPQNSVTECSIGCHFRRPYHGPMFIFYRLATMFAQYFVVAIIAVFVWRFRVKSLILKYPSLRKYLIVPKGKKQGLGITAAEPRMPPRGESWDSLSTISGEDTESEILPQGSHKNGHQHSTYRAVVQEKVRQLLIKERQEAAERLMRADEQVHREKYLMFSGHVSDNWGNWRHCLFMFSTIIYACWCILVESSKGEP